MFADRENSVEFYDFLQVNTDSENMKDGRRSLDKEEDKEQHSEGSVQFIDFLKVGSSSWIEVPSEFPQKGKLYYIYI